MAIPIAVFGQNPQTAAGVAENMNPDFETTHISMTLDTALTELPALFAGESVVPASGMGTNVKSDAPKTPKYLIFGAGLPVDHVRQVTEAVKAKSETAKFVQVNREDMAAAGATGPDPKMVGEVLKAKLIEMEKNQ